jgi:hypothetical protein
LSIENNRILKSAATWMNHEIITVSERSQSEMAIYLMITFIPKAIIRKSLGTQV